ncbi:hypothetical protein EBZ37_12860, partial [bacterium]|nr:hypothetical protein [bacterium]
MSPIAKTTRNIARIDRSLLQWVTGLRHPGIDRLMRTFTRAGDWQTWTVLLLAALLAGEPYRALAWTIIPKLLGTFVLCRTIKGISRRPRPSEAIQDFQTLLKNPDPYSFPSSHSACAWVVCASLGFQLGWGWPLWIAYA